MIHKFYLASVIAVALLSGCRKSELAPSAGPFKFSKVTMTEVQKINNFVAGNPLSAVSGSEAEGMIRYAPKEVPEVGQVAFRLRLFRNSSRSRVVELYIMPPLTSYRVVALEPQAAERLYFVNNSPIGNEAFDPLFSSFKLSELLDRVP